MDTAHEDALLGFDLDFLHPTANNIPAQALKQRYIAQIKKRIVRVDALNSHYNSLKQELCSKNKELDLIKKKLESTNQEHTQTSLEYKEMLDNFSKCEKECQSLKTAINNYQEKYYDAENRVQAGRSHVVQLQQLVKEYEGKIEILQQNERRNSEKILRESIEKELLQWKKKYKKDVAEWRTKCDNLRKQIEETKTATAKLKKQSLPSREKIKSKMKNDSITQAEENSEDDEDEISVDYTSEFDIQDSQHNNIEMNQISIANKHNIPMEVDGDCKIERISVDTGYGSSLTSSDNEKWLHSPDYYFSPINGVSVNKIRSSKLVDTATSPILSVKVSEIATSPMPSVLMVNEAISPIPPVVMVNVATSPINVQSENVKESEHKSELTINNVELTETNNNIIVTEVHCPVQIIDNAPRSVIRKKKSEAIFQHIPDMDLNEKQAKKILQLKSSDNQEEEDCNTDREIEMILSNMRLDHKLITPIPRTPKKIGFKTTSTQTNNVYNECSSSCTCPDAAMAMNVSEAARVEAVKAKEDIAKTKESQKALISNLATVMKEMVYIKSFLKSRLSMPNTALEDLNDSIPDKNLFENVPDVNLNDENRLLFESSNLVDHSIKQTESVRPPTSSKLAPGSVITVLSEQIIKPSDIEHVRDKQVENDVLSHPAPEIISEKCVKQNESSERSDTGLCLNSSAEIETFSPSKQVKGRRVKRVRKLSNLAKYRFKCQIRKYKIKTETAPLKKLRIKPKQIPCRDVKKVTRKDTSATLNDKQVYAKAVKVMAELNALSTKESVTTTLNNKVEHIINAVKEHYNNDECKTVSVSDSIQPILSSGFTSPIPKIISPIPDKTPPTPTISHRRSTRSSKLIDASSDTAITSSNFKNSSSIPVLRSPKPSIVSSTPTKTSLSLIIPAPTTLITSPRRSSRLLDFAATSPKSPVTSPKSPVTSLKSPDTSPKSPVTSPKSPVMSPNSRSVSKRLLFKSPNRESTLPDVTSPISTITSPKLVKTGNKNASYFGNTQPNQTSVIMSSTTTSPKVEKAPILAASISQSADFGTSQPNENYVFIHKDHKPVQSSDRKRKLSNSSDICISESKRVLRSSVSQSLNTKEYERTNKEVSSARISPQDLPACNPKESILCSMIEKYGIKKVRPPVRHISESVLTNVNSNIEQHMSRILEGTMNKDNSLMVELVEEFKTYDYKIVVAGLTKYITNPERKMELFGKIASPPAPHMTKSEAVLLFVIRHLKTQWHPLDIVDTLLCSLEHTLFKLNRTPEFEVIESVSHFYALLCRYFGLQSRLKVFMLDAMYCILFKSAPLIKECLEVWPHIIPLAHMPAAKTPLITIFVFLLHFYKCEDRYSRVQEIRNILQRKYSYQVTEWNEGRILELVGNSISELRDIPCEKKMLRIAIIILAKRNGPRWTQNNIMKRLFQFIEKESLSEHITEFCVSLIGPLVKPYPVDMKVHCEIVLNQLVNVLDTTASRRVKEASISSMLIMSRHNTQRVNEILMSRKMEDMSPELADQFRVHIRMKSLNAWLNNLSRPIITS